VPHIGANLFDYYGYQVWIDNAGFFMAVGSKGQFIFISSEKNLVAVFTSNLVGRDFYIPKKLLHSYIFPAAVSKRPLASAPKKMERLNVLIDNISKGPKDGFIWKTQAEGTAKDGKFVRTTAPAFQFEYPTGSKPSPTSNPKQVMAMKTQRGIRFDASVLEIPAGIQLSKVHLSVYAPSLENTGTDIQIISNESIVLKDGTPAYRSKIKWKSKGLFPTTTSVISAFKEGRWVCVAAHPWTAPEEIYLIFESLRFNNTQF
jgi:hypothetical protein